MLPSTIRYDVGPHRQDLDQYPNFVGRNVIYSRTHNVLVAADNLLQRTFGVPYLLVTRDYSIHERCRYLIHNLQTSLSNEPHPLSVLDAGCGSGILLRYLLRDMGSDVHRYIGVDLDTSRLIERFSHVRSIQIDFLNINLDDDWQIDTVDLAWCSEVLEHLVDDVGALRRIARSVRPRGFIIITVPSLFFIESVGMDLPYMLKVSSTQDGGHVRRGYSCDDLRDLARAADLEIMRIDGVTRFDAGEVRRRYERNGFLQIVNNCYRGITRSDEDAFLRGDDSVLDQERFLCLGALLRVR